LPLKGAVKTVVIARRNDEAIFLFLEPISKLLSAVIGCKARGSAFSVKRVLDVLQHASEPFSPRALTTNFSLDLASKSVLKWVLIAFATRQTTQSIEGITLLSTVLEAEDRFVPRDDT
jgi:hypothetical protein